MSTKPRAPADRYGYWMLTYTGRAYWPLDPRPEEVHIADIARGLSMECRYGGQVNFHYSVAQHTCLLHDLMDNDEDRKIALLHDATEAFIKDIIRGAKSFMAEYETVEALNHAVICKRFGISPIIPPHIKDLDHRLVIDEQKVLQPSSPYQSSTTGLQSTGMEVIPWGTLAGHVQFMKRFTALWPKEEVSYA